LKKLAVILPQYGDDHDLDDDYVYSSPPQYTTSSIAVFSIPLVVVLYWSYCNRMNASFFLSFLSLLLMVVLCTYYVITSPRSYVIYRDHIKIFTTWRFFKPIHFSQIKAVREATIVDALLSYGFRYSSSIHSEHTIEIICKNSMSVIMTPAQRESFLSSLSGAVNEYNKFSNNNNYNSSSNNNNSDSNNGDNQVIDIYNDAARAREGAERSADEHNSEQSTDSEQKLT